LIATIEFDFLKIIVNNKFVVAGAISVLPVGIIYDRLGSHLARLWLSDPQ